MISATEELRALLDERGVEWRSGLDNVTVVGDWCFVEYDNGNLAATCEPVLMPEQAVAATLGDDEYESKMDALLCRLTNGKWSKTRSYDLDFMESCVNEEFEDLYAKELAYATLGNDTLTADQVRECVKDVYLEGYSDGAMHMGGHIDKTDWQAIADELNARAERTCCNIGECRWFCCSECGFGFGDIYINNEGKYDAESQPRYCPNCGAKVVNDD